MTLYVPGTEQMTAVGCYWNCTDSPYGVGHALVLWTDTPSLKDSFSGQGAIFTDNTSLARKLVSGLTCHFPEFKKVPIETLDYSKADFDHRYDGNTYLAECRTGKIHVEMEWTEPLDRKQILWPDFPAGSELFDLSTVICPCRTGQIRIDGSPLAGQAKVSKSTEGDYSSSAFLAFGETWIGPLEKAGDVTTEED